MFGAVWLAGEMLWRVGLYCMIKLEITVVRELYERAMRTLLTKDIEFFHNRFGGTITKNVMAYGRRFEGFVDTLYFNITSELIPAIFAVVVLWVIAPLLAVALVVIMLLALIVVLPLIRYRARLVRSREDANALVAGHVSDVVSNIAAVKSYGAEDEEIAKHDLFVHDFTAKAERSWMYQNSRIDMVISPFYVAANTLGLAIVLNLGVDAATKAHLFVGFSYFALVTRFLWEFNSVYRNMETTLTEASLFVAYDKAVPQVTDKHDASVLVVSGGKIEFDSVTYTHAEHNEPLFKELSLTITPGEKIGLVGHSGAGKSTLVNLLLRFVDVDSGDIRIDNQSLTEVTQKSLHQCIAYVPQEPLLFHRSLRANITYGKSDATDTEIVSAARRANTLEFIDNLPHGFDTVVGERGVKLSGGQRQRIAIARAILKDAPILILDEATSALDSESEGLIQSALAQLMEDRTTIVIAHRLSTIQKMDRIVVLDKGRVVEQGAHDELLRQKGKYAALWARQSGGFISE